MSWRPIRTAPKDGSHFIAGIFDDGGGFGWYDGKQVATQTVVHWWGNPGEEGFYTSVNELAPQRPFQATHWQPLPEKPALRPCGCIEGGSDFCAICY